jgi:hypothetical protein
MVEKKVEVSVDLSRNRITVIRKEIREIFPERSNRFILERDRGGFSAIEKRDNKYYFINVLRREVMYEPGYTVTLPEEIIEEKELSRREAERLIKESVLEREKERYY